MASIFLQEPVYITVQQVKDSTSKATLASLTDNEIKILIYKAQREVDSYLQRTFRPPFVESQEFIFPVLKDEVSFLPSVLTEATLYVVEQLYISGDVINGSISGSIMKETTGPHSIEYASAVTPGLYVPDVSKKLLDGLKNIFNGQVI